MHPFDELNPYPRYAQAQANVAPKLTGPQLPEPESPSKIRDAFMQTESLLSDLEAAVSALERRLDVILTPAPPQVAGVDGRTTTPVVSHFLSRIGILNEGIASETARLRALAGRVEV